MTPSFRLNPIWLPAKEVQDTFRHLHDCVTKALLNRLEAEAQALLAEGHDIADLDHVQWPDGHSEIHVRAETYRRRLP